MPEATDFDESLGPDNRLTVIKAIERCRRQSEQAREERIRKNKKNRDLFLGRQDWTHKMEGQSKEFLPKLPVSVEQMSSFVKRGLVQHGDWFSVRLDSELEEIMQPHQVRAIMRCFLEKLWDHNNNTADFATKISDGVKNGLLESLMIFKIHGGMMPIRTFRRRVDELTGEEVPEMTEDEEWYLRIDLINLEDYYPDPTGNNLYEIHRVERDLHEVLEQAEQGLYDLETVRQLIDHDFPRPEDEKRQEDAKDQRESVTPSFRKRVVLDEFWGTILNDDGTVAHRNVVATVANDKYLIRGPEPNPFWHQESPFVVAPLVRLPGSVFHKALYDHAADLNVALNELFNLMLDGGIASVWGVRQVRLDDLEDPGQISGGLRQGSTLAVKSSLPHGNYVVERVDSGDVPQDAMAMFEAINREYTQAALTNELKMGALPPKQVRATEVMEASQSQAVMLDGMITDLEVHMKEVLRKSWLTIVQNADSIPIDLIETVADRQVALLIMRASPAERFELFAGRCDFKVSGLSQMLSKAMDFQKLMALLQSVSMNPLLFQAFIQKFSPDKTLRHIMRVLNINPDDIQKDRDEMNETEQQMQQTMMLMQMMNGQSQGLPGAGSGDSEQASVNQEMAPRTGMVPNA